MNLATRHRFLLNLTLQYGVAILEGPTPLPTHSTLFCSIISQRKFCIQLIFPEQLQLYQTSPLD